MSTWNLGTTRLRYPASYPIRLSEENFLLPIIRKNVNGVGAANPVSWRSSSMRDGVRTARGTAPHTVCRELGGHKSRAVGSISRPLYPWCRNLDPVVSEGWSPAIGF